MDPYTVFFHQIMTLQNSSYGELYSSIGNCFLSLFSSCADRRLKRKSEKKKRSLCWIRKCEIPVIGRPLSMQLILPGTFLWISSVRDATDETNRPRRPCHHCQKKTTKIAWQARNVGGPYRAFTDKCTCRPDM